MISPRLSLAVALATIFAASSATARTGFSFSTGDSHFQYAYIEPGRDGGVRVVGGDYTPGLDNLQSEAREPLIWFERDGREYVVRDARQVERARVAVQPMMDLGAQQGRLGRLQGELGARQGRIGAVMGALGARLGALATREAVAGLNGDDTDALADERASIEKKMNRLGREQEPLSRQQQELGTRQSELGRRQQAASRRADVTMKDILEDAIRQGVAERLSESRRVRSVY